VDWLVTNYSKKNNVAYIFTEPGGEQRIFNVYLEYKSQLKSFSKSLFDPFKRGTRVTFHDSDGQSFETTIGQLNFFRWALRYNVIQYALDHAKDIERDMMESTKRKRFTPSPKPAIAGDEPAGIKEPAVRTTGDGKRSYLSQRQPCTVTMLRVKVTFG
jgi:hypothetical protein